MYVSVETYVSDQKILLYSTFFSESFGSKMAKLFYRLGR